MFVLLDTTVLIDCLRGQPAIRRLDRMRDQRDVPCTTPINVEELVRGMKLTELDATARFIDGVVVLPLGAEEGWRAGAWRREFSSRGVTLSQADCLIAAAALCFGAAVATGNPAHFPMHELRVEHWPVGA